ncbi:MAG: DNA recombination protein RmuC [Bacteroidales bacterium]|jgi:DNA recombination protein RmuC|nr:DNA recombination protein RmuC [Bacteroidales bacterium]MDD4213854.1 DNA recombination protein RmuC [Bacteroidales bacterium]
MLPIVLSVIVALVSGAFIVWFFYQKRVTSLNQKLAITEKQLIEKTAEVETVKKIAEEKNNDFQNNINSLSQHLAAERERVNHLIAETATLKQEKSSLIEKLDVQKKEVGEIRERFLTEFENLATKILKQNTVEFSETNKKKIEDVLTPLKDKLLGFEKQVAETYEKSLKDQTDLKAELKKLHELNNHIVQEAHNLTRAIKGDVKQQGNWGELVLEKILESSGLIKGEEYETQYTLRNEEGDMLRPDVIVKLPDNKHIIIDSKVSLIAYEQLVNTDDVKEKEHYAGMHVDSIRTHIKKLSEKNYYHAKNMNSPEFVLMFLPIESSFSIAVQNDVELFNFAWERKVVIVSPSTLLATLRTIESIWKREKQTQNAIAIAKEGGNLYDKFAGLVEDLKKLGQQLDTVRNTYEQANKKLYEGKGSLIKKVENLKILGAKGSKKLPEVSDSENDNDD